MSILKDIEYYEGNVKVKLSDTERLWVAACADMLIASFKTLDSVDTSKIAPFVTVLDIRNVFRDDIVKEKTISHEELLSNAPEQYNGYFQVPKTLD